MFNNDMQNIFSKLGLKKDESSVYLSCLNSKSGLHVQEIANTTKVKRSTVNLILDRLVDKGFITYHIEGSRRVFSAESPQKIIYNFEELISDFKGIIPFLLMSPMGGDKLKVRFFEGAKGMAQIHHDILLTLKLIREEEKELLAISSGRDVFEVLPDHRSQFIDKRVRERIPIRWIAPESKISRDLDQNSKEELREIKFFDHKKYPFHIEIDIFGSKIALMSWEGQSSGIIMENRALSDSFRALFNLIWDCLK